jgi:glycosyltransferase involved in cell wall biosynthesis
MNLEPLEKPIAFVVPWYGEDLAGGAERLCHDYVQQISQAGIRVEILTTCVRDFSANWNKNHYKPKTVEKGGVTVRRFPVRHRNSHQFDIVNYKLLNNLSVTAFEEQVFFFESVRSEKLERFLAREGHNFHLVFMPYCYGTTFEGLRHVNYHGFLLPCLHHERYAVLRGSRKMHESVLGLIFNSESEQELAATLYAVDRIPQVVLGAGIDMFDPPDPEPFRRKYGVKNPYVIYVGRMDVTKNTHVLVGYFEEYLRQRPETELDLVLAGRGGVEVPRAIAKRVHHCGFISEEMKRSALAGAELLVQPSARESFSIVLMESWMAMTPVAVNEYCKVGVEHCRRSNGGLYFNNYAEFEEVVRLLTGDREMNHRLAENGRHYVIENFRWDRLVSGFVEFIRENALLAQPAGQK